MATRASGPKSVLAGEPVAYADDYYGWLREQAKLVQCGRAGEVDHLHLADEIEDLGRSEYNALQSDLTMIIQHMLKWDHQPSRRSRSWKLSIREHRRRVLRRLKASPSLSGLFDVAIEDAFWDGRDRALAETGLGEGDIPNACPYSAGDILDRVFGVDQP